LLLLRVKLRQRLVDGRGQELRATGAQEILPLARHRETQLLAQLKKRRGLRLQGDILRDRVRRGIVNESLKCAGDRGLVVGALPLEVLQRAGGG
jgi:hypothetical protein